VVEEQDVGTRRRPGPSTPRGTRVVEAPLRRRVHQESLREGWGNPAAMLRSDVRFVWVGLREENSGFPARADDGLL